MTSSITDQEDRQPPMLKMDPNQEIENIGEIADDSETDASVSVDDFIKQLEEKEKDLHITAETTIIEIAQSFDDANMPDFLKEDLKLDKVQPPVAAAVTPAKAIPGKPSPAELEKQISQLKEQIVQLKADRSDAMKTSERRAKDFQTYKSRTERERQDTFQNQVSNLATQMLPILDNLNRAVDFALAMSDEQRTEIQQFFDGIILVSQQVNDVLAEMGIQPIATVGEMFDPHFHEAVATEESEDFEPNMISAELLRGYRIGDRVIRHSMVKVARVSQSNDSDDDVVDDLEAEVDPQDPETPDHGSEE